MESRVTTSMAKALVVVESPAKAKTINKYLGRDYKVVASMGHIRDLPKSKLGVDVDNDFAEEYESIESRKKVIKELKDAAKDATDIYVATDPDREGEAIGWHLIQELKGKKRKIHRLTFNEITKKAVQEALKHPARHRREDGRRAAGAPRARSAGRLQDQPAALGQGAPRPERRPRAVGGAEAGLRPRARDRGVRPRGVLEHLRAARRPAAAGVRGQAAQEGRRRDQGRQRGAVEGASSPTSRARRGSCRRSRPRSASATRRRRSSPASCSRPRASRSRRR